MKIKKGKNSYVAKEFISPYPFPFEPTADDEIRAGTSQRVLFDQRCENNDELKEAVIALHQEEGKSNSLT